jgi:hypothetical protein
MERLVRGAHGLAEPWRARYKPLRGNPQKSCRSVAQSGSAPRSGRGGRRFESSHSDHLRALCLSAVRA